MKARNGFTLIELILVMALVAILSVIGIGSYTQATIKSRDTERKNDLNQIAKALEMFNNDVGSYPLSVDDTNSSHYGQPLCVDVNGNKNADCLSSLYAYSVKGDSTSKAVYMESLPKDPVKGQSYVYANDGAGGFALYAALENSQDRDSVVDSDGKSTTWDIQCGSVKCNYKLTELGLVREK